LWTTPIRIGQSLRALELALRTAACSGVSRTRSPGCNFIALDRDDHVATSMCATPRSILDTAINLGLKPATIPLRSCRRVVAVTPAAAEVRLVGE